jgi:excisionase family DNA binding protein
MTLATEEPQVGPEGGFVPSTEHVSLVTVDEAAKTLRLSRASVYRRIRAGELGAVRLGVGPFAPVRIEPSELWRYINENRDSRRAA